MARHDEGWHKKVLCFARFSLMQTALIAINISNQSVVFFIDLANLKPHFSKHPADTVVLLENLTDPNAPQEHFFLKELVNQKRYHTLSPYSTLILGVRVIKQDPYVFN